MKSTEIAALSFVIAVCRGISRYASRRSMRLVRSVIGLMRTSPGPRVPRARPSRNSMIRWYSRTIFTENAAVKRAASTTAPTMMPIIMRSPFVDRSWWLPELLGGNRSRLAFRIGGDNLFCLFCFLAPDPKVHPLGVDDCDGCARPDCAIHGRRAPGLTANADRALRSEVSQRDTFRAVRWSRGHRERSSRCRERFPCDDPDATGNNDVRA